MCSQTKQQLPTCTTFSFSWCRAGYSKYSLDITCWSRITGLILCVRDHRCLPLHALLLTPGSPWAQASLLTTAPYLAAPLRTSAITYIFSQSLCKPGTPHSRNKGKGRSLPAAFKRHSKKPDGNEVPGFYVSTWGRTSRWQRNHPPHCRCRCQESLFLCFSPMLIFQEDEIYFFFFLNWIVIGFEVPPHLTV